MSFSDPIEVTALVPPSAESRGWRMIQTWAAGAHKAPGGPFPPSAVLASTSGQQSPSGSAPGARNHRLGKFLQQLNSHKTSLLHVNSFQPWKKRKRNSSFYLPIHCDSIIKQVKMGLFCYTVYSECIVLCLWKVCFKLYFHMFCWGQSTLSLKVTEVCFRTEGNLKNSCQESCL